MRRRFSRAHGRAGVPTWKFRRGFSARRFVEQMRHRRAAVHVDGIIFPRSASRVPPFQPSIHFMHLLSINLVNLVVFFELPAAVGLYDCRGVQIHSRVA